MSRKDFLKSTKNKLAQRAGFQCSHPDCDLVTIGPGEGKEDVSNIGEAAHIYSASKKGPRGQGELTEEQLRNIDNGIWMCKVHARLIDTNGGHGFTSSQLISWKGLHEEKIKKYQGRLHRKLGWINKIVIGDNPVFKFPATIDLGKVTFIEGEKNGSGKSAICEWISSIGGLNCLERWLNPTSSRKLNFNVEFWNPDRNNLEVLITKKSTSVRLNDIAVPFNPLPVQVIYFTEYDWHLKRQNDKFPEVLCNALNVDRLSLENLFNYVGIHTFALVSNLQFKWEYPSEEDDFKKREILVCDIKGSAAGLSFNALSDGEKQRVILELAIAKAQVLSEHIPVILILEMESSTIDDVGFRHYFKYLMSQSISFQTLVTGLGKRKGLNWEGWARYKLIGSERDVEVNAYEKINRTI